MRDGQRRAHHPQNARRAIRCCKCREHIEITCAQSSASFILQIYIHSCVAALYICIWRFVYFVSFFRGIYYFADNISKRYAHKIHKQFNSVNAKWLIKLHQRMLECLGHGAHSSLELALIDWVPKITARCTYQKPLILNHWLWIAGPFWLCGPSTDGISKTLLDVFPSFVSAMRGLIGGVIRAICDERRAWCITSRTV